MSASTITGIDQDIQRGVDTLLDYYMSAQPTDTIVIAYTPDSREPAAWVAVTLRSRGFQPAIVPMRPFVDPDFEARLDAALPKPEDLTGRLVILTVELDTISHVSVLESVFSRYGGDRCMILRIINASTEFFTMSLNLLPAELSALNAALLNRLYTAKNLRIRTESGTDLQIEVDSAAYEWISNRGVWRAGGFTLLPPGEIATYPVRINGTLVADGAFNANIITTVDARLSANPVTVQIKENEAVDFECADQRLMEMLTLCFATPYGRHVGELGFGTNSGIDRFIPTNSHINERRPGVHIGFGQHNQSLERVSYVADIHLDLIAPGAKVWLDDDPTPIDLAQLAPTDAPHPDNILDEDIGDCCGLVVGQLRALACRPTSHADIPRLTADGVRTESAS
jgi:hypothetical protein